MTKTHITTATIKQTESAQRLARATEILANGLPTTAARGDGLFVAFKTLAKQGLATMVKLPGNLWAFKTTNKELW